MCRYHSRARASLRNRPKALPSWDSRTRRNNLSGGLASRRTVGPSDRANSPHPSSREGHHSTAGWSLGFLLSQLVLYGSHAAAPTSRVQRNSVPSTQMRCRITANRRASATIAFLIPRCRAIFHRPGLEPGPLTRVFQRGGVIGRHEVIAPNDPAPRSYYERPIVPRPTDPCFRSACRVSCRCVFNNSCRIRNRTEDCWKVRNTLKVMKLAEMRHLSFAEYLERRRPSYTRESLLLEQLKQHSAFRSAVSSEDIETYLDDQNAPWGVREAARAAWTGYQAAKRKRASRISS